MFKKYNTDSAGFARSLKYYSGQPKDLKDIYAQVKKNIDKIAKYEQKLSDEERRKNEISFKKQKEKLHRDSLKLAVSKKEKATLDSIMKFSVKRRKPLLDSLNKKKIERLRADFRKYHRIYLPWKEFKVPAPVKKD